MGKIPSILFKLAAGVWVTFAASAYAQEPVEEVIVTGSYIKGTPEDAASPVDVTSREDMDLTGNPSVLEMLRNMGPIAGIDGETNQFQSNGLEAASNVNLRGLGAGRTLVLLNGSRLPPSPYFIGQDGQQFVNTNAIPTIALQRIEVLKDGASATYGSDAVAGVVNFITRANFRGIELQGAYKDIEDAEDPDYEAGLIIGMGTDRFDLVISGGYQYRGETQAREKDWALQPYATNSSPGGWSSIGNPGTYFSLTDINGDGGAGDYLGPDAGCEAVGGSVEAALCKFRYTEFDNIAEEEKHYQIFVEGTYDVSDTMRLHGQFLYAKDEAADWKTSPSYPPQVLLGGDQLVVPGMPHYDDYVARNNLQGEPGWDTGALMLGRTFGVAGPSQEGPRKYDEYWVNLGLSGEFDNAVGYDARVTYGWTQGERKTNDTRSDNNAYAWRGLGGPNCDQAAFYADPAGSGIVPGDGNLGQGDCFYYNPFTSGFQFSQSATADGTQSPGYQPEFANTPELSNWMVEPLGSNPETNLLVLDFILNGDTGVSAGGGEVSWAGGLQFRRDEYKNKPDFNTNVNAEPCAFGLSGANQTFTIPDTPLLDGTGRVIPGWTYSCIGAGAFNFLAAGEPFEDNQSVYAAFGELSIPFTDRLEVQVAARYEDYGGDVGSTFDPKVAARWDVMDTVTLRGSISSSFRAPTLNQLGGRFTSLSYIGVTGAFKAVDTTGNPDLEPEEAITLNFGVIWQPTENIYTSLDYWNFDFTQQIVLEPYEDIVTNCFDDSSPIQDLACSKITFQDPSNPVSTGVQRIATDYQNGPDVKTDGIDYKATYDWSTDMGVFTFGTQGVWINSYEVESWVWAQGFDAEGYLNSTTTVVRPLPDWKNNAFVNWSYGPHNLRLDSYYTADYKDERAGTAAWPNVPAGTKVDDMWTFDLSYNFRFLDDNARIWASVYNFTDEDPPEVLLDLNYDPYTATPFGMMWKVGVSYRFTGGPFQ